MSPHAATRRMRRCTYRKDVYPSAVEANDPFFFRAPNGGAPVVAALGRGAAMRYPSSPASDHRTFHVERITTLRLLSPMAKYSAIGALHIREKARAL